MKRFLLALSVALTTISGWAQEQFTGMWQCEALKASMIINLVEKKIPLKDFDGDQMEIANFVIYTDTNQEGELMTCGTSMAKKPATSASMNR